MFSNLILFSFNEKEELIADMIYNFVIPEVEKQRIREKIKQRQHTYLRTVHDTIFNKIETLPKLSDGNTFITIIIHSVL